MKLHVAIRFGILTTLLIPLLSSVLFAGSYHAAALGAAGESRSLIVLVSRHGFNGSDTFILKVNQGDLVGLTFVYDDDDLSYDNPHRMYLSGYGLETDTISRSEPQTMLEFVASTTGSFKLYCDIPCTGMDELVGDVVVEPSPEKSTFALTLNPLVLSDGKATVRARATDASGRGLLGAVITFYWETTFERFQLGSAITDSEGIAEFTFLPKTRGDFKIVAQGGGGEASATISMESSIQQTSSPWFTASSVSKVLVVLVVASVWATYAFAAYLLLRIRKAMRNEPAA